jgi:eukaryotic-like serine/threonine-protein kinase
LGADDHPPSDGKGKRARGLAATEPAATPGRSGSTPSGREASEAESGSKLGERYRILGLIGFGGMGTVYRVRDLELDEVVALKVLRGAIVGSPETLDRFRREVKLARRVTHPNVARTFDIGEHQGEKFLTMELVDGESLADVLDREGALPVGRFVPLLRQVCAGLAAAHAAGVVHRDLKPENILVARDGRVVVTDFGIARAVAQPEATDTLGGLSGTPAYMAPEQMEVGATNDARADIYALGAVLFEICTGERAWTGYPPLAVAAARLMRPPPDPRERGVPVDDELADLVLRCLARDPAVRPQTADELAAALERLPGASARSTGPAPPPATPAAGPSSDASPPPMVPARMPTTSTTGPEKTVAVLPFKNAGPAADAYLAEGLTDELTDALSISRGLRVRSMGAVLQHLGEARDPRDVGRTLGVEVIVEGSVRRTADSFRISCRVSTVHDGFQIWARRFQCPAGDLLVVGDEVAQAVARALTVSDAAPARDVATDPHAVELYLRGRQEYRRFWYPHAVSATQLFQQAHARAPHDTTLMTACALAAWRVWFFGGPGSDAAAALARAMAARAAELAPAAGESRLALAVVRFYDGDAVGAVKEAAAALGVAPYNAEAHGLLGRIRLEIGPIDDAIRRGERSLSLEPDAPLVCGDLTRAYAYLGDWAKSDGYSRVGLSGGGFGPIWFMRVRLLLWQRQAEALEAALRDALTAPDPRAQAIASGMLAVLRNERLPLEVTEMAPILADGAGGRRTVHFLQVAAEACAFAGNHQEAMACIGRAVDGGLFDLVWLDHCPLLGEARSDPRFAALRAVVQRRAAAVERAFEPG